MTPAVRPAVTALGIGLAPLASTVVVIPWVTNDMRVMLLLGAVSPFGGAFWMGSRRGGSGPTRKDVASFVIGIVIWDAPRRGVVL